MPARQLGGWSNSQRAGPSAVRPGTMSRSWPRLTSTMPAGQARSLNRPRRQNRVSSSPNADTCETRLVSTANRAEPQRRTDALTVRHPQPKAAAISPIASPRPARRVAQRPARAGQQRPLGRDLCGLFSKRPNPPTRTGAPPTALVPHQPHRAAKHREVYHHHRPFAFGPQRLAAA